MLERLGAGVNVYLGSQNILYGFAVIFMLVGETTANDIFQIVVKLFLHLFPSAAALQE
jgi:hypothetical protein